MSKRSTLLIVLAILCLAAAPAFAAQPVLRGVDAWTTVPEGTYANLVNNPLPAGFLCNEFPGFSGFIYLRGVPLMSEKGLLNRTDTIVERLDDAVFNKDGVALTRARVRALQLTGVQTLQTVCGEFKVDVTLDGEQPLSTMQIVRVNTKGGRYMVPLAVNTKIIFTRVDNVAERFEFADHVAFQANPLNRWTYRRFSPIGKRIASSIMVDTDWDGTPDTLLPAQSNFVPGSYNGRNKAAIEESHTVVN